MTDPTRPPAADPALPEAGQTIHHPQFPHGFPLHTAAMQLHALFAGIETINGGFLTQGGHDFSPLVAAGQSLARALAHALETSAERT